MTALLDRPRAATGRPRPRGDGRAAVALLAPAVVLLVAFTYLPAGLSLVASLFDVPLTGRQDWEFVGPDNYLSAVRDPEVHRATLNTLLYCALTIVPSLVIGLGLALLTAGLTRGRSWMSAILFLPFTANLVAMAVVFSWIFAYRGGFANQVLSLVGVGPINFLGDGVTALPTVALVGLWRAASFCMILFLAGLTAIPGVVHEAAAVDGLRGLRKLRLVTLPLLRPTLVLAVVVSTLQAVQVFDTIRVMTDGGPLGASETLLTLTWRTGFEYFRLGPAAALSFLLLVVLLVLGWTRRAAVVRGGE
ncbi:MAG: sugar ABC transporter permease [Pseudonocardiales bacterium]|nr:sugar ABC transporter permease [Pseudonocardiales bacterium]